MSSELTFDDFKDNMVVRVKNFRTYDEMPNHWVSSMLEFSNVLYRVDFKSIEDEEEYLPKRIHLKYLNSSSSLHGFFFIASDFKKANSKNE